MATHRRLPVVAPIGGLLLLALAGPARAQVSIPALDSPVSQDFNTLAMTGTSSTLPTGWAFSEAGTNANATYTAGTGSSNTAPVRPSPTSRSASPPATPRRGRPTSGA